MTTRDVRENNTTKERSVRKDIRSPYDSDYTKDKFKLLNTDPNFHYRWPLVDDPEKPARFNECESYGFEMVKVSEDKVKAPFATVEGDMYVISAGKGGGKHVLMKMPLETKEYHDHLRAKQSDEIINSKHDPNNKTNPSSLSISVSRE